MSGTSGDGVDVSVINSDGIKQYETILDRFYEYDLKTFKAIHGLKEQINSASDLEHHTKELLDLERKITLFHAKIINDINLKYPDYVIGFHGQTIYHNSKEKISKQLGDAKLLRQLIKKDIVYNFRKNDLLNGGEGAPLVPVFHQLIVSQNKIKLPACILNIGGISNITIIKDARENLKIFSKDLGPGNCLIDLWVRKNSIKKFDEDGKLALAGDRNEIIFEQAQELYSNRLNKSKKSFDISDFDISFARGMTLEEGSRTLTDFTASVIAESLIDYTKLLKIKINDVLLCGGGRKNKFLIKKIRENISPKLNLINIDDYNMNGDFIESQAFAFLAIRHMEKLPSTFPNTTGCKKPTISGDLLNN